MCLNSHPELGIVSTDITLYSSVLSVEEIGAVLFDAMDGNVVFGTRKEPGKHNVIVDKLKIRYDFEGENSEEYVKLFIITCRTMKTISFTMAIVAFTSGLSSM